MTVAEQRSYAKRWVNAGRLLDQIRWQELRQLDESRALAATDDLVEMALQVPVPQSRREHSGLVEQQALFHPHGR